MMSHYERLLSGAVREPGQRISRLPLMSEAEEQQVLVEWNQTQMEYPLDVCIHQLFEAQAERTPEAVALVTETEELSYRELNERATQLGITRREARAESGRIMMERREMVVSLWGCKARAYVQVMTVTVER